MRKRHPKTEAMAKAAELFETSLRLGMSVSEAKAEVEKYWRSYYEEVIKRYETKAK